MKNTCICFRVFVLLFSLYSRDLLMRNNIFPFLGIIFLDSQISIQFNRLQKNNNTKIFCIQLYALYFDVFFFFFNNCGQLSLTSHSFND